jgi:hypothetical protein
VLLYTYSVPGTKLSDFCRATISSTSDSVMRFSSSRGDRHVELEIRHPVAVLVDDLSVAGDADRASRTVGGRPGGEDAIHGNTRGVGRLLRGGGARDG